MGRAARTAPVDQCFLDCDGALGVLVLGLRRCAQQRIDIRAPAHSSPERGPTPDRAMSFTLEQARRRV